MGYKARYKQEPNFFIEGVSDLITDKTQLSIRLYNQTSILWLRRLRSFVIEGDDISFVAEFFNQQEQLLWNSSFIGLIAYLDIGGHITFIEQGNFNDLTNLKYLWVPGANYIHGPAGLANLTGLTGLHWYFLFPEVTHTKNFCLNGCTSIKTLMLPKLTWLDLQTVVIRAAYANMSGLERLYMPLLDTVVYYQSTVRHFLTIKTGCKVYVPPALETSDGGAREKLIVYLEDTRSCDIIYIDNFTSPDAVSDLSDSNIGANSVDLDFSTPSSTNTIDFYEVWIDDGKTRGMPLLAFQEIAVTGDTLSNLEAGTTYEIKIKTVDEYYNVSDFSNSINILIGNGLSNFDASPINIAFAIIEPTVQTS